MSVLWAFVELLLGFVAGTLVLWLCSQTVKTEHANLKTAATYNAIMAGIGLLFFGITFLLIMAEANAMGFILTLAVLTMLASFILLMRLYEIGFLSTLWLAVAMWVVQAGLDKLTELIF